jgi:alcohol dehydrogenase class IV
VVAYHPQRFKASIRSELMLPRVALLDAELAVGVPKPVTAASGADALCQVIESYTSANANPISDGMALEGIRLAGRSLRRAYDNGADLDAREEMAVAALLSGITLGNAGLGAVHGFAAPIGGAFPVPHGVVCAALLPHVIRTNVKALRDRQPASPSLGKYAQVGRIVCGQRALVSEAAIDAVVAWIEELVSYMQIPRLSNFGLKSENIAPMVDLAKKASSMRYNPIVLSDQELTQILSAAI